MTHPANRSPGPRFEIVSERYRPRPPAKRARGLPFGALFGAIRAIVEDAYVSLAREVMVRTEQIEDGQAQRSHAKRVRKSERQKRKNDRPGFKAGRGKTSPTLVS